MNTAAPNGPRALPNDWLKAPVGELFQVLGGGTPPTSRKDYWAGSIPWISSADIGGDHKITPRRMITEAAIKASATNLAPAGSAIVVTRVGLGKVGLAEQDLCFSQDSHALVFDHKRFDSKFVVLQMGRLVSVFKSISRGTTISGVTKKQLLNVEFLAPPLREQRRIVAEIEKQFTGLEAGVAALRRVQVNLKRYRAAVLKAAFEGRLVPTEIELAKAGRRKGKYETGADLLARILAERRQNWHGRRKYEEPAAPIAVNLPPIPEHWVWARMDTVCTKVQDGTHFSPKEQSETGDFKYITAKNIKTWGLDLREITYVPAHVHREIFARCNPEKGDILFIKDGVTTGIATVNPLDEEFSILSSVALLKPMRGRLDSHFLKHWLNSPVGYRAMTGRMTGTAIKRVILERIKESAVPLPPLSEQRRIAAEVERLLSVVEELELSVSANLQRAASLRQSILRKAFTGALTA